MTPIELLRKLYGYGYDKDNLDDTQLVIEVYKEYIEACADVDALKDTVRTLESVLRSKNDT